MLTRRQGLVISCQSKNVHIQPNASHSPTEYFCSAGERAREKKKDVPLSGKFVIKLRLNQQWKNHKKQMLVHLVINGQVFAQKLYSL